MRTKNLVRKVPLRPGTKRMRQGRSTGAPTKEQQARFDAIKAIGCIVCRMRGMHSVPCEIHHLTVGGKHGQKRRGHDFTIGLCGYHHRGLPLWHIERFDAGPSYALEPRRFREVFGQDDALLAYQDELIGALQAAA